MSSPCPSPSRFTSTVEALLTAARLDFDQADLIAFVRRQWPYIAHNPDAVAWAERFAETPGCWPG